MASSRPKLTLYRGFVDENRYVWTPFAAKVEFHLRHANLPYTTAEGSVTVAPKHKVPYADLSPLLPPDSSNTVQGDSALIVTRLITLNALPDLNASLSAVNKALDAGLIALFETKLYFLQARERWLDPQNFYVHSDKILEAWSWPMRVMIGPLAHRTMSQMLHSQGTGRYTDDEWRVMNQEILMTVNDLLETRRGKAEATGVTGKETPFWLLGGTEPTNADATAFGFISCLLISKSGPESIRYVVEKCTAVLDYANRIHARYFEDYERWEV